MLFIQRLKSSKISTITISIDTFYDSALSQPGNIQADWDTGPLLDNAATLKGRL